MKEDEVLLGERKKVALDLGLGLLAGIGGKVGDEIEFAGESDEEALGREVMEEIRVKVLKYKYMGRVRFLWPHRPLWNQDVGVYVVTEWIGVPEETEAIKPYWFKQTQLPVDRMWDDNQYFIPKVLEGETINAVFLYGEDGRVREYIFKGIT